MFSQGLKAYLTGRVYPGSWIFSGKISVPINQSINQSIRPAAGYTSGPFQTPPAWAAVSLPFPVISQPVSRPVPGLFRSGFSKKPRPDSGRRRLEYGRRPGAAVLGDPAFCPDRRPLADLPAVTAGDQNRPARSQRNPGGLCRQEKFLTARASGFPERAQYLPMARLAPDQGFGAGEAAREPGTPKSSDPEEPVRDFGTGLKIFRPQENYEKDQ
jgi:hypothetical protein